MKLSSRFQRLTLWDKIGVVGSIASIVALAIAIAVELFPSDLDSAETIMQSIGDRSPVISAEGDVHVSYRDTAEYEPGEIRPSKKLTAGNLEALVPNKRGGGVSPRYVDNMLGIPTQESISSRTYVLEGHRIDLIWGDYSELSEFVIGPAETSVFDALDEIVLSGAWGRINGKFGEMTVGDVLEASGDCWLSDWSYGGNGRCMSYFEIECGGSQARDQLFYRAGIDSCNYSDEYLNAEASALLDRPDEELTELQPHELLDHPKVRNANINFFMVTDQERKCSRGEGC